MVCSIVKVVPTALLIDSVFCKNCFVFICFLQIIVTGSCEEVLGHWGLLLSYIHPGWNVTEEVPQYYPFRSVKTSCFLVITAPGMEIYWQWLGHLGYRTKVPRRVTQVVRGRICFLKKLTLFEDDIIYN